MSKNRFITIILCAILLLASLVACAKEPEQNFSNKYGNLTGRMWFEYRHMLKYDQPFIETYVGILAINADRIPMNSPFHDYASSKNEPRGLWQTYTDDEGYYTFDGKLPQGDYLIIMYNFALRYERLFPIDEFLKGYSYLSEKEIRSLSEKVGMRYVIDRVTIGSEEVVLDNYTVEEY
jgi:hypothetical protein